MSIRTTRALMSLLACAAAASSARADMGAVAAFIDGSTVAVGSIDLTKMEPAALQAMFRDLKAPANAPGGAEANKAELEKLAGEASQTIKGLRDAGVRRMHVVFAPWMMAKGGPLIVVEPAQGTTPEQLQAALPAVTESTQPLRVGRGVVLMGEAAVLDQALTLTAKPRPEFEAIYQAAGDAPQVGAFIATPALMNMIRSAIPAKLPPEAGAVATADLLRGLKHVQVIGRFPAETSGTLSVECATAEDAAVVGQALETVRSSSAQSMANSGRGSDTAGAEILGAFPAQRVEGNRVVYRLTPQAYQQLSGPLWNGLVSARRAAMQVQSMSQQRQLMVAVHMYASDNKGALPASLDDLKPYLKADDAMFTKLTTHPTDGKKYVFIKPAAGQKINQIKGTHAHVLIHEDPAGKADDAKVAVGFLDGHVETVTVARLNELLKAAAAK